MGDRLRSEIAGHLQRYVYALVDPRDGVPFYIGKGTESRVLQHGLDAANWAEDEGSEERDRKLARISEIEQAGHEVDVWILRRGLTVAEYSAVEATVIDLLSTFSIAPSLDRTARTPLVAGTPLTNKVRGSNAEFGIARLRDIERDFRAPDLTTRTPLLLVTLGTWVDGTERLPGGGTRVGFGFKPEWADSQRLQHEIVVLGQSVCCWWTLQPASVEKRGVEHMVALYRGVTRGLFKIVPGSAETVSAVTAEGKPFKRSGYVVEPVISGALWEDVVGRFGHRVPKKRGERAQYRYWPYR
ncbi:GIY-YIG nuclease family protein [Nocardia sp. CA2R105]|uniref:GIY-YIG nuclease family protein n=1 Tax=Nocardia coffeae TaxID=2873381 RepID=UPI001CA70C00|nr:GIY-YIG nuclease family protein [Nocardia coffeae]MBY8863895.1 GIY-YIG nuclease family protein [Nocardia coffeae]